MAPSNKRVTKTRGKLDPKIINQTIEIRPIQRDSLDLGKWRTATRQAESVMPRRVQLYDMYADLRGTDSAFIAAWTKREDGVTSADWQFTDANGEPVEEINQLMDSIGFEELLKEIINAKGWGKTLLEPTFFINDNEMYEVSANLIPRKHCRPDQHIITKDQSSDTGINYKEGIYAKTVMDIGKDDDLGLFLAAAGYAILKRGAVGDWATFVEKFGQGIIDGEWDGYNEGQKLALSKALDGMGSGGVIIRPAGTKITAIMPTGNATGQLQMSFTDFCNKEIYKSLLGTTETIDSSKSSGYAQAETHQEENVKKNDTDINYVRRYLNSEFIKVLIAAGFNAKGGTFVIKTGKTLSKKDSFAIHKQMAKDLNIPIDDDFFYETYEVRKPDNYDELKAANKVADDMPPDDEPGKPAKTKKGEVVKLSDKFSFSDLLGLKKLAGFFQPARVQEARANQKFLTFKHDLNTFYKCCNHEPELITLADSTPKFSRLILNIIQKIYEAQTAPEFDQDLFDIYTNELTKAVLKGFGDSDVSDFETPDNSLIEALRNNIQKFSAAKTYQELQAINDALIDRNNKLREWKEFKIAAEQIAEQNLTWLKTEYETAIGSGQMAAKWKQIQEQKALFPLLQFDAVIDEHSTDLCSSLHMVIKPVDDDFWKLYFPLNHFNCRSTVRQLRDGEITPDDQIEYPVNMPEMFKKNLAAEGVAFPEDHPYFKDVPKSVFERVRKNDL
ncbi:MAG: DUF935 family protein [Flavobacteriales bacterium]|nr:MAG: DUF935 family protein [Flavobacteriales bacterium]